MSVKTASRLQAVMRKAIVEGLVMIKSVQVVLRTAVEPLG